VPDDRTFDDEPLDGEQLVLGDLINRVLDKGVVISGHVTISVADIDLVALDLRLVLSSVQSAMERLGEPPKPEHGYPSLLPPPRR
jgi:gas vesicle structural protein